MLWLRGMAYIYHLQYNLCRACSLLFFVFLVWCSLLFSSNFFESSASILSSSIFRPLLSTSHKGLCLTAKAFEKFLDTWCTPCTYLWNIPGRLPRATFSSSTKACEFIGTSRYWRGMWAHCKLGPFHSAEAIKLKGWASFGGIIFFLCRSITKILLPCGLMLPQICLLFRVCKNKHSNLASRREKEESNRDLYCCHMI